MDEVADTPNARSIWERVAEVMATLLLVAESIFGTLGFLASLYDPIPFVDRPLDEAQLPIDDWARRIATLLSVIGAVLALCVLRDKRIVRSNPSFKRAVIIVVPLCHFLYGVEAWWRKGDPAYLMLISAAIAFVLTLALKRRFVRRTGNRAFALCMAVVAVAAFVVSSSLAFTSERFFDGSADLVSMAGNRVAALVTPGDRTHRSFVIADSERLQTSLTLGRRSGGGDDENLVLAPSGKFVAYDNAQQEDSYSYDILDADGRNVSAIADAGLAPAFVSDLLLTSNKIGGEATVLPSDGSARHDIGKWVPLSPWNEQSILASRSGEWDGAFALVNLADGSVVRQEPAAGVQSVLRNPAGVFSVGSYGSKQHCSDFNDLNPGVLRVGLPAEQHEVVLPLKDAGPVAIFGNATSTVALVHVASKTGSCSGYADVYAVDLADGHVLSRVFTATRAEDAVLSPDGKAVAYVRNASLYVKPTAGGSQRKVSRNGTKVASIVTWTNDGSLWFVSSKKSPAKDATLNVRTPDGSTQRVAQLTK